MMQHRHHPPSPAAPAIGPGRSPWSGGAWARIALVVAGLAAGSCECGSQRDADQADEGRGPSDLVLPGAEPYSQELAAALRARVASFGPGYRARTRHLLADGAPAFSNRLVLEASPYLRQHAHNPVNWYPWGDEAFAAAARLGRPVLLSVGYSTCHWCHVMEEESFEDLEIAQELNAHYVAIKVDREELPDVDSIYMAAVLRVQGSGGWPMTVWLTPDRRPFYADTYIPPRAGARGAQMGLLELLRHFRQEYQASPETVTGRAQALAADVARMKATPAMPGALTQDRARELLLEAATYYRERFDEDHGGMAGAPKFPSNFPVRLLLRLHRRTGDADLLDMARATLDAMAQGGIHDHLGGGFHRYAVDARWRVPHFEKMLYDQALLALAYLEGYQATGEARFADVARGIFAYLERDMSAPLGGFYSATDADSLDPAGHMEEGAFFTWTPGQLAQALAPDDPALAMVAFEVTPQGDMDGTNVLRRTRPLGQVADQLGLDEAAARDQLEAARRRLFAARAQRPAPLRDDKVLVAWNGMVISALARAARVLDADDPAGSPYLARARRAADFILGRMTTGDGGLWRVALGEDARVPGYLDDYAFLIAGLIDVFEAGGEVAYLERAVALDRVVEARFEDREGGGFFLSSDDHDALIAREKPSYDGAVPSGSSVAAMYLLRLHALTGEARYLERAQGAMGSLFAVISASPGAMPELAMALDFWTDRAMEIVIVAPGSRAQAAPFTQALGRSFTPNAVARVLLEAEASALARTVPLVAGKIAQRGETTAYVCHRQVCELPTRDPATFARQLEGRQMLRAPGQGQGLEPENSAPVGPGNGPTPGSGWRGRGP